MDYWSDTRYDVSIHTRHYWRVKQRTRIPGPARRHVSIHTRHYWRVKRARQSTLICGLLRFNPHPPLLAGETPAVLETRTGQIVSIHTRHYWRVKHRQAQRGRNHCSFNPHPPLLAGETPLRAGHGSHRPVSIHTRHYWRVKHPLVVNNLVCRAMFQSTPAITGG